MASVSHNTSRISMLGRPPNLKGSSFRSCDNCNCSPGLLSRNNKRSSLLFRKFENTLSRQRSSSINFNVKGSNASVYSSDALCKTSKEINTSERLASLRKQMTKFGLCCYIVPTEDEHQSEYVSEKDERRSFISGFSGSAGIACVTRDLLNFNDKTDPIGKSILSTDGRYFNQALQELDFNWSLLRQGEDKLTWEDWCITEAIEMLKGLGVNNTDKKPLKIGIDPKLITYKESLTFEKKIRKFLVDNGIITEEKAAEEANKFVQLVGVEENLIDLVWGDFEEVPNMPTNDLILLSEDYHGESFASKRSRLLENLRENHHLSESKDDKKSVKNYYVTVALDEIAWLLNLRGSDIKYNPVFFSYLLISDSDDETVLFSNAKYDDNISKYLKDNNITVQKYEEFWSSINDLATSAAESSHFIIPDNSSWNLVRSVENKNKMIHSPINVMKSVKNATEINNAHKAQTKDALCLIQFFAWLEDRLVNHETLISEYEAAEKLEQIRKVQKNFIGNSFETISSSGANAAVIHYSPTAESSAMINPSKIYLCDAGSQFLEGTTDITRTMHLTEPTQEETTNYTLVLKGNLALERAVFPEGTNGYQLDCIARQFLWERGLDYRHGTGHGIGATLNVHEGPIGIQLKPHLVDFPLAAGNIISNEPGYYKDGEYGIRIENDILVKETEPSMRFGDKKFFCFENMTLVPYCRKLIDVSLLDPVELKQVNDYNRKIWDSLVNYLQPQSITFKYLKRETSPL
ncbi:hypothetical protein TPHA_0F00320 [Tetrapisispora phaffii CBS 4417]|uniref:Xaa-Pro aminopeptidase n=1 Tax=Tetrapisispora phaffii (strain ATCC 24235 / CBS 4417 / NBRC 1672 / NRRL Y-8282 / UCD 70-5) TaxID=1071381 RepID=G8BUT7_TETPH|nr:hypothetical protein TPHA_0F00320 [Tetrapisispora phaffii CBS 4417]CCE63519.1 hypothetical protein TPHA_0F00320 [Tetrapisispora phaffii CBS 4417]